MMNDDKYSYFMQLNMDQMGSAVGEKLLILEGAKGRTLLSAIIKMIIKKRNIYEFILSIKY